eukprot:COSAG01_NODE_4304_length_5158_cov_3.753509_1_plen_77_part_00
MGNAVSWTLLRLRQAYRLVALGVGVTGRSPSVSPGATRGPIGCVMCRTIRSRGFGAGGRGGGGGRRCQEIFSYLVC